MRPRSLFTEGLVDLYRNADPAVRRSLFRQSFASLGSVVSAEGPGALDGLAGDALARSARIALSDGLFDDLSWLAPDTAAVALYEIADVLPNGAERRELRRRVARELYEGDAATFVALATRMAQSAAPALNAPGVRARVALALALPRAADIAVDRLALALISRRDLAREWVAAPSTRSLPERRMAARLLEGAAREAARRARAGDQTGQHALRGLSPPRGRERPQDGAVARAARVLLADREPLVWRHAAAARGLMTRVIPELRNEIETQLATSLSPTEWRRAATALCASLATDPEGVTRRVQALLGSTLLTRDAGLAGALLWGLGPVLDLEPEAGTALLRTLARHAPIAIAEGLVELGLEVGPLDELALRTAKDALGASLAARTPDDGLDGLGRSIFKDLDHESGTAGEVRAAVLHAVQAFATQGPREAFAKGLRALDAAAETQTALEALDVTDDDDAMSAIGRRTSVDLLRDLDSSLLEAGVLSALLELGHRSTDAWPTTRVMTELEARLASWLLAREGRPGRNPPQHTTMHMRQLRALLHLLDGAGPDQDDGDPDEKSRERCVQACRVLENRLHKEGASPLRRTVLATVARALDALVRDEVADPADVVLHVAENIADADDMDVLAEASMHPDVSDMLRQYAVFSRRVARTNDAVRTRIGALEEFVATIPADASQRADLFHTALLRLAAALVAVEAATALESLVPEGDSRAEISTLTQLEDALGRLTQLARMAEQRCGGSLGQASGPPRPEAHPLPVAVQRAAKRLPDGHEELVWSLGAAARSVRTTVPRTIAELVIATLARIPSLPPTLPAKRSRNPQANEAPLPAWLPARRTIGGFYVLAPLGGGAAGSVLSAVRVDERQEPRAERFALKVPDYDATAARHLSEAEFLRLFREEASALLTLPEHPNIARFVTFDAGARPKPILVMELIEGPGCDELLDTRALNMQGALGILDGVASGLAAMHGAGIGHLDVKPTNVVLRGGREAVLVDFGLAGRHIRLGCATGSYGAPEVWGAPTPTPGTAMTADVYSFGCLAFEVLTSRTLFDAPNEVALIAAHLSHDGLPSGLVALGADSRLAGFVALVQSCLQPDPARRPSIAEVHRRLYALAPTLRAVPWPAGRGASGERAATSRG